MNITLELWSYLASLCHVTEIIGGNRKTLQREFCLSTVLCCTEERRALSVFISGSGRTTFLSKAGLCLQCCWASSPELQGAAGRAVLAAACSLHHGLHIPREGFHKAKVFAYQLAGLWPCADSSRFAAWQIYIYTFFCETLISPSWTQCANCFFLAASVHGFCCWQLERFSFLWMEFVQGSVVSSVRAHGAWPTLCCFEQRSKPAKRHKAWSSMSLGNKDLLRNTFCSLGGKTKS